MSTSDLDERINAVRTRLKEQGFNMKPVLPLEELEAFESKWNVRLPESYRQYVLNVQYGGPGPYNRLETLDLWDNYSDEIDEIPEDYLSHPCALTPECLEMDEYWRIDEQDSYTASGMITVSDCGCGFYVTLVVSGPYRERIIYYTPGSAYFCDEPDFLSWFERWLEERSKGYEEEYFGWGPAGEESSVLAAIPTSPRQVIIRALSRYPEISNDAVPFLLECLDHSDEWVRDNTLYSIHRARIPTALRAKINSMMVSDFSHWCREFAKRIIKSDSFH